MDGRISMYVLLVCVWCSLDASGLLMVVTAEPTVSAVILTPEADRQEGGQVDMRCTATNLESDHIMVWSNGNGYLRRNGITNSGTDQRFMFHTDKAEIGSIIENLTISELHKSDTARFVCNIVFSLNDGTDLVVATDSVTLSVLYFPGNSFPSCSPAGPMTVKNGSMLNMKCLSELGNPTISMDIFPISSCYKLSGSPINGSISWSLDVQLLSCGVKFSFECVISSDIYTNTRSCLIGPIDVIGQAPHRPATVQPPVTTNLLLEPFTWIVAFGVSILLFILSLIVVIGLIVRNNKLKCDIQDITEVDIAATGSDGNEQQQQQLSSTQSDTRSKHRRQKTASPENVYFDNSPQEYENVQYPKLDS